jgi:hypothetical protein
MEEEIKQPEEKSLVDVAKEENAKMQELLGNLQKEREALERLRSDAILSGRSEAGRTIEKPKEETPQEYKNRLLREAGVH